MTLKAERELCWGAKDKYWACLTKNNEQIEACLAVRKEFEKSCSHQWVKHFDRKRKFELFKEEFEKNNLTKSPTEA